MDKIYKIAVDYPKKPSFLTYKSEGELPVGHLVEIPLGRRKSNGVVWEEQTREQLDFPEDKLKFVKALDPDLSLSKAECELYSWMSRYYHYPLGQLIYDCLPPILKRPQKKAFISGEGATFDFILNPEQERIYQAIEKKLNDGFTQHLIHGVTGSGKSIIFIKLILETIKKGKSVQFLIPEINLTPQLINYFKKYVPVKILSYHSAVTKSEKNLIWKSLKNDKEPKLILGVRSSIFLPIENLGLIIVDEEHDSSFKQNDRCPYNGRDVAIKKAQIASCPIVLGSATPSFETFHSFQNKTPGKFYYSLKTRAQGASFPKIKMVDAKKGNSVDKNPSWPFLPETLTKIESYLNKGEQVLIFINKLGFASFIQCPNCAHRFTNEQCGCDNNLRFFKNKNMLSCAHCEYKCPLPQSCPECGSMKLMQMGFGTERIQEVLAAHFPNKKTDRFDRDEITNFTELNEKLDEFNSGKIDILVGTQMLSKGHNFSKVNLVVILGIDAGMNVPDFRAHERTFQSIVQVAGRAGRYSQDSEVVIQSLNPEHSLYEYIITGNEDGFYQDEMPLRDMCNCPPYTKMAMLYFSSKHKDDVISEANRTYRYLDGFVKQQKASYVFLSPPTPCMVEKRANQFSWTIMLKTKNVNDLHQILSVYENGYEAEKRVSIKIDVDPFQMF